MVEKIVVKRRIAPQPVHDDEVPETTLPASTVLHPAPCASDIPPPQAGRRIKVDLSQGYEINFAKLLHAAGVSRKQRIFKDPAAAGAPTITEDKPDLERKSKGVSYLLI